MLGRSLGEELRLARPFTRTRGVSSSEELVVSAVEFNVECCIVSERTVGKYVQSLCPSKVPGIRTKYRISSDVIMTMYIVYTVDIARPHPKVEPGQ